MSKLIDQNMSLQQLNPKVQVDNEARRKIIQQVSRRDRADSELTGSNILPTINNSSLDNYGQTPSRQQANMTFTRMNIPHSLNVPSRKGQLILDQMGSPYIK